MRARLRGPRRSVAGVGGDRVRPARVRPVPLPSGSRPSVTVVVPCFNYARYLPQAVGSALGQDGVDVDVVVVDDASTDESLAVARELSARDPRVRVVAHHENRGPVETFNDGLALAEGEFLVRLDADDLLTPGSLARSTALALAFPDVGLVYGRPVHFSGHTPPSTARTRASSWTLWCGAEWLAARCRSASNVITSPEVLMRRAVVDRVGGQQPLAHTHDMEMWLRIAAFSDVGHVDGADQAWHREHAASLSAREVGSMLVDLRERRDAFEVLFGGAAGSLAGSSELHRAAREALADEALDRACHAFDRGRADQGTVDGVLDLVRELVPDPERRAAYRALQRRIALGPARVPRRPHYVARAVWRRARGAAEHRYWQRWGVYRGG